MLIGRRTALAGMLAYGATISGRAVGMTRRLTFGFCESCPPICSVESGKAWGLLIDLVNVIAEGTGLDIIHEPRPWKRAQEDVKSGVLDFFCTVATPAREEYAVFTEPVISLQYVAHHRKDFQDIKLVKSLSELLALRNVNYIGHGWAEVNLGKEGPIWVATDEACIKMVANGRADIFIDDSAKGRYQSKTLGFQEIMTSTTLPFLPTVPFRIGLSKLLPGATDLKLLFDERIAATQSQREIISKRYVASV